MNPSAPLSALAANEAAWIRLSVAPDSAPTLLVVPVREDPDAARFRAEAKRARQPGEQIVNARIRRIPDGGYFITTAAGIDTATALWRAWFADANPTFLHGCPVAFARIVEGRITPPRTLRLQDHSQVARRLQLLSARERSGVFWFGEAAGSLILHIDKTPRALKERRPDGATTLISGRIEGRGGAIHLTPRAAISRDTARRMQRWIAKNAPQWPALRLLAAPIQHAA